MAIAPIKILLVGDALLSPGVTRLMLKKMSDMTRAIVPAENITSLTEREREMIALVGRGMTNSEIAEVLVVSPLTTKTHVSRAMIKLGVRDRAQLVVVAYESGLVRPGWA